MVVIMKKVLVLLLSVILLFACLPTVSVYAAKQPTFVVSNEKANAGDTVKITVSTKNNSGIISMKLHIKYDKESGHIFMTGPAVVVFDGELFE